MSEPVSERPIILRDSTWELLDAAAELDGEWSPGKFIDSVLQGFLMEDNSGLERQQAINKLRKLFGDNHG